MKQLIIPLSMSGIAGIDEERAARASFYTYSQILVQEYNKHAL